MSLVLNAGNGHVYNASGIGAGTVEDPFIPYVTSAPDADTGGYPTLFDETNMIADLLLNAGSEDQAIDGSSTPKSFSYTPPAGYDFVCIRVIFYMEGGTAFNSNLFGNQAALTNGWQMKVNGNNFLNAKNNRQLGTYMFDMQGVAIFGKEDKTMIGRFTFGKLTSGGVGLVVKEGNSFETIVQDNLSSLTYLEARVEGVLLPVGDLYAAT